MNSILVFIIHCTCPLHRILFSTFLNLSNTAIITHLMSLHTMLSSLSYLFLLIFFFNIQCSFLLLYMPDNFCLVVRYCLFYFVGCWIHLILLNILYLCPEMQLNSVETVLSFGDLLLSFIRQSHSNFSLANFLIWYRSTTIPRVFLMCFLIWIRFPTLDYKF